MNIENIHARKSQLTTWINDLYPNANIQLSTVSGDASFRHYYRFTYEGQSYIALDSPPTLEDNQPFIDTSQILFNAGIHVPEIIEKNSEAGFFILTDFGDCLLLPELNETTADRLYELAIDTLIQLQSVDASTLPKYDAALLHKEMQLFSDWYLEKHQSLTINTELADLLSNTYDFLASNALNQPQVFVHRDYHSRNLMLTKNDRLGVIDHQDAVFGPITYDLVSLLRDCYIAWPQEKIDIWVEKFFIALPNQADFNQAQFTRWFDLMGTQRHLKAIGIFCRLNYRDGKPSYIHDIPRTLNYLAQVSKRYAELQPLHHLIQRLT